MLYSVLYVETGATGTGGKTTGAKEKGAKETGEKLTGAKETGGKATGARDMGGKATGAKASGMKATGAQDSQETGGKGNMLVGEREIDNMLPDNTTARQNATGGIRRKSYSEVLRRGSGKRGCLWWDSVVRKTDRAPSKGCAVGVR